MDLLLQLVLPLALALAVMQLPLLGLAWLLGRRLRLVEVALGQLLPWILLAPWISSTVVLAPCNILASQVPGFDAIELEPERHSELNDAIYQFLPWEVEVRRALRGRRLPFWSDLLEGGSALWSNPQAQAVSPVALAARLLPLQHFLLAALALKILVAFQGAFVLARVLGAARAPALLAGGCFALGGGILAWGLFPHTSAAAWAPWVVAGAVAVVRGRRRGPLPIAGLALATAAVLLSGHPEVATGTLLLGAVCGVLLRRRRDPAVSVILMAAAGGLLGAGLAAPHLVPFAATMAQSLRAAERAAADPPPEAVRAAPIFHYGGQRIFLAALHPHASGRPFQEPFRGVVAWPLSLSAYAGLVALLGAAAALTTGARRRAGPLIGFWLLSLILGSRFVPLEEVLFVIPALRVPELSRLLPLGSLALAVAGALGYGALRWRGARAAIVAGVVLLVLAAASGPLLPLLAPTGLVIAGAVLVWSRRQWTGVAVLLLAILVELIPWGRAQLPRCHPAAFFPPTDALWVIQQELAGGPWRAVGEHYSVYPSILPLYGLAELRPHNPLAPVGQLAVLSAVFGFSPDSEEYFSAFGNVEHPLLDFLNVRVVVSNWAMPAKQRLEGILEDLPFILYRNPHALPRWFLPTAVETLAPRQLGDWLRRLEDGRRVAVEGPDAREEPHLAGPWDPAAVEALAERPGRVQLSVRGVGSPRLVATSIPGPDGWRARAPGGERLATVRINGAFLGVRVPPGVEVVELAYLPPGLALGLVLAAISAGVVGALLLRGRPRKQSQEVGRSASASSRSSR
jgi:hypothetical protein